MRSANKIVAAQLLAEHGIQATNLTGGIDAWAQDVDPTLPRLIWLEQTRRSLGLAFSSS